MNQLIAHAAPDSNRAEQLGRRQHQSLGHLDAPPQHMSRGETPNEHLNARQKWLALRPRSRASSRIRTTVSPIDYRVYRDHKVYRLEPSGIHTHDLKTPSSLWLVRLVMGIIDPGLKAVLIVTAALSIQTILESLGGRHR